MRELATTLLDVIGLLLLAAGAGFVVLGLIELASATHGMNAVGRGAGLSTAGAIVLAGSWLAARQNRPRPPGGGVPG